MGLVVMMGVVLAAAGCGASGPAGSGSGSGSVPVLTGGIAGPDDGPRGSPPVVVGGPGGDDPGDGGGDSRAPLGGVQRVWAWYNPGTSSADVDGQRGIALDRGFRSVREGGWGQWIERVMNPLGNPPVVLRAPFGTSRWVDGRGEERTAFRYEDAVDVARDPEWAWLVGESQFVRPWARYPAPVMFHVGTADDRELTQEELRMGVEPFIAVKRMRDAIGNTEPVYVCLDHSMYFDDQETEPRPRMSRRLALQTAMSVTLLERAGVEVLTEAVPHEGWPSAEYWVDHGVAFRPHLAEVRGDKRPVSLEKFEGLVLAWLLPADFRDRSETDADRRRRVVEATRRFGNVAVPSYLMGGDAGWAELQRAMRREAFVGE